MNARLRRNLIGRLTRVHGWNLENTTGHKKHRTPKSNPANVHQHQAHRRRSPDRRCRWPSARSGNSNAVAAWSSGGSKGRIGARAGSRALPASGRPRAAGSLPYEEENDAVIAPARRTPLRAPAVVAAQYDWRGELLKRPLENGRLPHDRR